MSTFRILGELFGGSRKPQRIPRGSNGNGRGYSNGYGGSVEVARAPVMTTVPADQRLKMLERVVAHYVESYKENARIIGVMDEKAQRTGAFGGVFIAAVIAFFARTKGYELLGTVGYAGLTILSLAVFFFLVSAVAGMLVMWVRFIEGMAAPSALGRITEDLLDATLEPGAIQGAMEDWYRTQSTTWAGIIASQAKAMMRKSRWLTRAQRMMLAGLVFISGFTVVAVTGTNLDLAEVWIRGVLPR